MILLTVLTACREEQETTLAELAQRVPQASPYVEPAPPGPIFTLAVSHPGALADRLNIALPLIPGDQPKGILNFVKTVPQMSGAYLELFDVQAGFDEESKELFVQRMDALLIAVPASGDKARDQAPRWLAFLEKHWPARETNLRCKDYSMLIVCAAGNTQIPLANDLEDVAAHGLPDLRPQLGVVLRLNLASLVAVGERLVGEPLFWAVVPEEIRNLEEIRLSVSEDPDEMSVMVSGADTGLLKSVGEVFVGNKMPVELPAGTPFWAYAVTGNVEGRLEQVEEFWAGKLLVSDYKVSTWVDDTWRTQLLNLASGVVGIVLVGDVPIHDPLANVVYFLQATDRKLMDKRLNYVFSTKHFKTETGKFKTGEEFTRVRRKRGRKMGKEKLVWFYRDSTYFLAASSKLLEELVVGLSDPGIVERQVTTIDPARGDKVAAIISLSGLAQRLTLSKKAGLAENLALGMFKKAVLDLEQQVHVEFAEVGGGDDSLRLIIRTRNVFSTFDALLKKVQPVLQYIPQPGS